MSKRGRPPIPFQQDRDRYLLAVAAAFPDLGTSRKGAVEIAVAAVEGWVIGRNRKPRGRGLNMLADLYALRSPSRAASIDNRQRELRRKLKRCVTEPIAGRWLAAISQALLLALGHTVLRDRSKNIGELIVELAASVGEEAFAQTVLLELWRMHGQLRIVAACRVRKIGG